MPAAPAPVPKAVIVVPVVTLVPLITEPTVIVPVVNAVTVNVVPEIEPVKTAAVDVCASAVQEILESNNWARFNNSFSPKSPIWALLTLGANRIKNAVFLSIEAETPVAA